MAEQSSSRFPILGVNISAINMNDALLFIEDAILTGKRRYICTCPVNTIMECKSDGSVLESVNSADLATPDGMPTVWIGRMRGHKNMGRVYGPDLLNGICDISAKKGYKHYFYGSSENVIDKLGENLKGRYSGINIGGMRSPPYRQLTDDEDKNIVDEINKVAPDIVWVGLGSPKQDLWMHEHRARLNASVIIGVGAAFDFLAGVKPQAPQWVRDSGFEWLFRLMTEPKRLWRRYLINNSLFIYYIIKEMLFGPGKTSKTSKSVFNR